MRVNFALGVERADFVSEVARYKDENEVSPGEECLDGEEGVVVEQDGSRREMESCVTVSTATVGVCKFHPAMLSCFLMPVLVWLVSR